MKVCYLERKLMQSVADYECTLGQVGQGQIKVYDVAPLIVSNLCNSHIIHAATTTRHDWSRPDIRQKHACPQPSFETMHVVVLLICVKSTSDCQAA